MSDAAAAETLEGFANGRFIAAAVLAVLLVAFNIYGRRFCLPPAVRFLVWSASTVFLLLSSSALSALEGQSKEIKESLQFTTAGNWNNPDVVLKVVNMWTLLLWILPIILSPSRATPTSPCRPATTSASSTATGPAKWSTSSVVLCRGADLGRRLVEEYAEDEASACRHLADFWSEMMLFVAPSTTPENVKGHVHHKAYRVGGLYL